MSYELDTNILDFINTIEPTSKKEIKYITDNDWSISKTLEVRVNQHKLHLLLTDRNVKNASKFYNLSKADTSHPKVKQTLKLLSKFFEMYVKRAEKYIELEDWSTKVVEGSQDVKEIEAEIEFQSELLSHVTRFKEVFRKINSGDEIITLEIPIHNDTPIPLMMQDSMEERYPEIKDYLKQRREKAKQNDDRKTEAKGK